MSGSFSEAGLGSGKYRTLFELGQGGTANVSLAVARGPQGFKKLVVKKQLRSAYAQDPEFRAMFMTEARLSARLNHQHVVQVFEVMEQGGAPTIVMEYIDGQTLDAVLSLPEPRLPLELHLRILADVLAGLHYSHELRDHDHAPLHVVHRDVSPHNVMVSYEGVAKILDFGIAKLSGSSIETEAGVIKGKLRYMPPEQVAGDDVDRRADVFAVGVMLWEALSGTKLWRGLTDAVIMNRVLNGAIPEPASTGDPIPEELLEISRRALAPVRDDRYASALEFQVALEGYLARRSHYVSAREVAGFMAGRFASARASVDQRIELELSRSESSPPGEEPRGATPPRSGYTASSSADRTLPRSRLWLWAFALFVAGSLILAWGLRRKSALPLEAVSHAAPRITQRVRLSIEARPAHAVITLDGVSISNPYSEQRTFDAAPHRVRISAPGYLPDEVEVRFDADVRMSRALSPIPTASPPREAPVTGKGTPPRPGTKARAVVSATPEPTPPSCDPPFFLDARGIKKFKPECL